MAFSHGSKAAFKYDNSAGTLTDLSSFTDSCEMPRERDTAEVSTFGDNDKEFVGGQRGGTISVGGPWDPTVSAHFTSVMALDTGVFQTVEYGPAGSAGGAVKYSAETILTSFNPPAETGDAARWTAELLVTGAVTIGTF